MEKPEIGTATTRHAWLLEQVGTKHDTGGLCALCTALLAEGVSGESVLMGELVDYGVVFLPIPYVGNGE